MRAGGLYHSAQLLRVFEHRAGPEHVVVERLSIMVGHEERGFHRLEQRFLADVRVGIVDEHAGVHVAVGVDVQIGASASDAAADELGVVLEVHREERLLGAVAADAAVHLGALLRRRKKLGRGVVADGHVVEVPNEVRAHPDEAVIVLLRGDGLKVRSRIARRNAVEQLALAQKVHRVRRLAVNAVTAAGIGRFLKALERDGRDKVLHAQHIVGELFVDERAVRKGEEDAVVVIFAELDEIGLADERFAAGVDVHVNAHVLALTDDVIDLVKGEIELVAIFRSPAAGTVEIAGAGGIKKDRPGDVAVVLLAELFLLFAADHVGVDEEIHHDRRENVVIDLVHHVADKIIVRIRRILDGAADRGALCREASLAERVRPVHQLGQIFLGVLVHEFDRLFDAVFLHGRRYAH